MQQGTREDRRAAAAGIKPRALTLELTKGCNLRCGYCYYAERDGAYDPRTSMSPEIAEHSVDLLLRESEPGRPIHLHLFGGEPLLNMPLLRHVVGYGERRAREQDREITFEVTTNGTRFDEATIAFLNEHRIHVGVSFDGPPDVQDVARPVAAGSSHARALPGIERLLATRRESGLEDATHCSVVITRRELDILRIVEHLEELGFTRIILTPATDLQNATHGVRREDLPTLLEAYDALAERFERAHREGRKGTVTFFESLLDRLLSGTRKTAFCEGGREYLGVAANGDVSLCYRFYEDEEFSMGSVQRGIDRGVTERLMKHPLEERLACGSCWARYFCGGGCHHENLISSGGLGEPNPVTCDILRHVMGRTLEAWCRLSRESRIAPRAAVERERGTMNETLPPDACGHPEEQPCRLPTCHLREVGDESVVYEPKTHELLVLNRSAAAVFELCDGTRSITEITDAMTRRFAAPRDRLLRDVVETLQLFREKGIVV